LDYPKNYRELIKRFSNQDACVEYLAHLRWKGKFVCPKCKAEEKWKSKKLLLICRECEFQSSVLVGTLFQDTKLSLTLWFQLIWWFVGQKNGVNALSLQNNFGIGSYRTAWSLLKKLRLCMVPSQEKLTGEVEVDEGYLGGPKNRKIIVVAAEIRGKGTGRIRMRYVKNRSSQDIQNFIIDTIEPGAIIVSDRFQSYITIKEKGYEHKPQRQPFIYEEADGDDDRLLPRVHRVISLMKRWFYGTYHGKIDTENLPEYLNEFVFRFNRRTSKYRGLIFQRVLENAILYKKQK
jgi:transposase-like protein